jgi:uncharacterized membrane protein YdjX (TVP38/TMEM64 family)
MMRSGMTSEKKKKLLLLILLGVVVGIFFYFDLARHLSLAELKARQSELRSRYEASPLAYLAVYAAVYVAVTAASLPGATILTLAGGGVFGVLAGTAVVSVASTTGATLAFFAARYLLRDPVQRKFGARISRVNEGVRREGAFYLFTLRLVPVFPFFVVNLVAALTPLRAWTYVWVSWLGMLPGTVAYVNAGTQLGRIDSIGGVLSPAVLASFAVLGLLPLVAKKAVEYYRRKAA